MSLAGSPLCRYNAVESGVPDTLEKGPYDAWIFDVPDTLGITQSLLRFSYGFLASRIRCQDFWAPWYVRKSAQIRRGNRGRRYVRDPTQNSRKFSRAGRPD